MRDVGRTNRRESIRLDGTAAPTTMSGGGWRPKEIVVHEEVLDDPVTTRILAGCPGVQVRQVASGRPQDVVAASKVLSAASGGMLDTILKGKGVLFITSPGQAVDVFTLPDSRMVCPHFDRLKLASNACPFFCEHCYLRLTYRAAFPYMTVRVGYDKIKSQIARRLARADAPVMFNAGELADSLALEHLTGAAREFIPWFGRQELGFLFLLTKSASVEHILDLDHAGHSVLAWSMNAPSVSRRFELGAPSFERRLAAAVKAQEAGYRVRVRLDPVVPVEGWREAYAATIARIFEDLHPERITIGTLRFEETFHRLRGTLVGSAQLRAMMDGMEPMLRPADIGGGRVSSGKMSFPEAQRVEIFRFVLDEIRKHSECRIALCKDIASVWQKVGLELSQCACVCQLDAADMT